jgi:hypothetical protein
MGIDSFFFYHTPNRGKIKQKKPPAGDFFNSLKGHDGMRHGLFTWKKF